MKQQFLRMKPGEGNKGHLMERLIHSESNTKKQKAGTTASSEG